MMGGEPFEAATVTLHPGDTLALYTDGVIELTDADWAEYGIERLEGLLRQSAARSAREMIDAVVRATRAFTGRDGYEDDFTLVVVKREGARGEAG